MTVVILGRAVLLGEDGLCCLACLDYVLIVILGDLIGIDGLNVCEGIVYSDLAVVGIIGLEVQC